MDKPSYKLVGAPCGHHGQYTFYKAIRLSGQKDRIVAIGDFFFVRIWQDSELVSVGELQLLWTDRISDQTLVSLRLYFLPENTPDGRGQHGEDEVLAINDKVVLRAEDLLSWVCNGEGWRWGLRAVWRGACAPPADPRHTTPLHHTNIDFSDVETEKNSIVDTDGAGVVVFSYPRYCRYRALLSRLEGIQGDWLRDSLVAALGGYAAPTHNTRILYCKDTFEYPELEGHEFVCNHLAPKLKGRPRGRRRRPPRAGEPEPDSSPSPPPASVSPEPDSDDQRTEPRVATPRRLSLRNGPEKHSDEEYEKRDSVEDRSFMASLRQFYRERNETMHAGHSLKDLSLRALFEAVSARGGYEAVCRRKLWRALCAERPARARRHYERFLLPYENHSRRNGLPRNGRLPEPRTVATIDVTGSPPPPAAPIAPVAPAGPRAPPKRLRTPEPVVSDHMTSPAPAPIAPVAPAGPRAPPKRLRTPEPVVSDHMTSPAPAPIAPVAPAGPRAPPKRLRTPEPVVSDHMTSPAPAPIAPVAPAGPRAPPKRLRTPEPVVSDHMTSPAPAPIAPVAPAGPRAPPKRLRTPEPVVSDHMTSPAPAPIAPVAPAGPRAPPKRLRTPEPVVSDHMTSPAPAPIAPAGPRAPPKRLRTPEPVVSDHMTSPAPAPIAPAGPRAPPKRLRTPEPVVSDHMTSPAPAPIAPAGPRAPPKRLRTPEPVVSDHMTSPAPAPIAPAGPRAPPKRLRTPEPVVSDHMTSPAPAPIAPAGPRAPPKRLRTPEPVQFIDNETGETKDELNLISKPAEELNREFLESLPKDEKPLKITVKPVEKLIEPKESRASEERKLASERSKLSEASSAMLNELAHKLNLSSPAGPFVAVAPETRVNGHGPPPSDQQKSSRPAGRSSLRAVRVKPTRPQYTPANTPPISSMRTESSTSPPQPPPLTNFGIHHPPAATNTHSDDEIVEVPYKPKTPEIIDLDEYPESPQSVKKKKLDILKERGLEVTAIPTWPLQPSINPLITPSPMLLNPVQHQIMTQAQIFQMYNIIPPSYNGVQPPRVIQATSLFGTSGPEKTVYGNPKDPFMPPPHILHGTPLKPLRNIPATTPPQDILDLTLTQKPAVEIVRVPTTPSPSKGSPQNLTKNYTLVDGKAVVGSNLEITLVNPRSQTPNKNRAPQKRSSNGKFVSSKTPTPPKESTKQFPSPSGVKKNPIVVPNYQINARDDASPTSSTGSRDSQSNPTSVFKPNLAHILEMQKSVPSVPLMDPVYMNALYNSLGHLDQRQLSMYRDLMANQFRYTGLLNLGVGTPTTKN